MSDTYRKNIRVGICCGSNTNFYRKRRRTKRHRDNNRIRAVVANNNIEDIDDVLNIEKIPKRDSWNEPTDGSMTYHHTDKRIKLTSHSKILRLIKKRY